MNKTPPSIEDLFRTCFTVENQAAVMLFFFKVFKKQLSEYIKKIGPSKLDG